MNPQHVQELVKQNRDEVLGAVANLFEEVIRPGISSPFFVISAATIQEFAPLLWRRILDRDDPREGQDNAPTWKCSGCGALSSRRFPTCHACGWIWQGFNAHPVAWMPTEGEFESEEPYAGSTEEDDEARAIAFGLDDDDEPEKRTSAEGGA